jgi:hypothetical protein
VVAMYRRDWLSFCCATLAGNLSALNDSIELLQLFHAAAPARLPEA